ncbi:hypothetical protein Leryth_016251 [Lithospermum erythrorhizon]|nr:hypothetical protein Leryth_016251 [Lithospermum erythrorhizon]
MFLKALIANLRCRRGGALLRSPHRRYVGGAVDCYDYVDGSSLSLEKLKDFRIEVDIYVEHNDLNAVLGQKFGGGKLEPDFIEDVEDDVDVWMMMAFYLILMLIAGLENDGIAFSYSSFSRCCSCSTKCCDGDIDLDCGDDVLKSDNDSDLEWSRVKPNVS